MYPGVLFQLQAYVIVLGDRCESEKNDTVAFLDIVFGFWSLMYFLSTSSAPPVGGRTQKTFEFEAKESPSLDSGSRTFEDPSV